MYRMIESVSLQFRMAHFWSNALFRLIDWLIDWLIDLHWFIVASDLLQGSYASSDHNITSIASNLSSQRITILVTSESIPSESIAHLKFLKRRMSENFIHQSIFDAWDQWRNKSRPNKFKQSFYARCRVFCGRGSFTMFSNQWKDASTTTCDDDVYFFCF